MTSFTLCLSRTPHGDATEYVRLYIRIYQRFPSILCVLCYCPCCCGWMVWVTQSEFIFRFGLLGVEGFSVLVGRLIFFFFWRGGGRWAWFAVKRKAQCLYFTGAVWGLGWIFKYGRVDCTSWVRVHWCCECLIWCDVTCGHIYVYIFPTMTKYVLYRKTGPWSLFY